MTELITQNIWQRLTSVTKKSKSKSVVAVAYFSKGGAKLLPLTKGSILLVDASEKSVSSGQTCPADLIKLYNKGVKIYSKEWLHAKMFVIGSSLYIGSTNVSRNSTKLTEAVIKTSENKTVDEARKFIKLFCQIELGKEQLKRLQKKYKEPRFKGPRGISKKANKRIVRNSKPFFIYHLKSVEFSRDEKGQSKIGLNEATLKRVNKIRHIVDEFVWKGKFVAKKGDTIMQVFEDGRNTYVYPPSTMIHQRRWINNGVAKTLCYVEMPNKKAKNINFLNKIFSASDIKLLTRNGIKNKEFAEKMMTFWK